MTRRTLATRVSLVQTGLTLGALAVVVLGTWFGIATLLERKTDSALLETTDRIIELVRASGPYALDGEWMDREISEMRPANVRVEFQDPQGFALASSGPGPGAGRAEPGCRDSGPVRACAVKTGRFFVVASINRSADRDASRRLLIALLAVTALTGGLVSLVSRRVARRALLPLTDLTGRIENIEPGTGGGIGVASEFDELELLRTRFDELVGRFNETLARERRLTAQASHELRTPLGVARAEVEALSQTSDFAAGRTRALAALDRLSNLIEALLWFARAQGRLDDERIGVVNVADVVRTQALEREHLRVCKSISCDLPDEALVRGDEHLLSGVTANLLDNAIKHGDGNRVEISADTDGQQLRLHVSNTGAAPTREISERLFEPFFRGVRPKAEVPGFGLGLPFARAVARAHGGNIELKPDDPEVTEFILTLPLVDWADSAPSRSDAE